MLEKLYRAIRKDAQPSIVTVGGAWRSDAMHNIKAFMETQVEGLSVIA